MRFANAARAISHRHYDPRRLQRPCGVRDPAARAFDGSLDLAVLVGEVDEVIHRSQDSTLDQLSNLVGGRSEACAAGQVGSSRLVPGALAGRNERFQGVVVHGEAILCGGSPCNPQRSRGSRQIWRERPLTPAEGRGAQRPAPAGRTRSDDPLRWRHACHRPAAVRDLSP